MGNITCALGGNQAAALYSGQMAGLVDLVAAYCRCELLARPVTQQPDGLKTSGEV